MIRRHAFRHDRGLSREWHLPGGRPRRGRTCGLSGAPCVAGTCLVGQTDDARECDRRVLSDRDD